LIKIVHQKIEAMKNLLLSLIVITSFAACKSDLKTDTANRDIHLLSDSAVYNNTTFSDTPVTVKAEPIQIKASETPRVIVKKTKKNVPAKSTVSAPVYNHPAAVPPVVATPPIVAAPESTVGKSTSGTGTSDNTGTVATTPQVEKKKGWSKAAQGAAIGGVTGAVGGAILSKKKGLGAVVGGVVGAAGGYIIGKKMDKKENKLIFE
jgi:hypothetical protein